MKKQEKNFLILNGGSSSLKFALYNQNLNLLFKGLVEQIGDKAFIQYNNLFENNRTVKKYLDIKDHAAALRGVNNILVQLGLNLNKNISDLAYRVVHGGPKYKSIEKIDSKVEKEIIDLKDLAPLHNPIAATIIKEAKKLYSKQNHWAIFDTGFYHDLSDEAKIYPLPYVFYEKHKIQKYGFHGTSHAYILEEGAKLLKKPINKTNIISCHLGSGASITAIKNGKAIETSMGLTPLEGLMMATRCGDIDPAIIFYLEKKLKLNSDAINKLLNNESGWFGISGHKDMRDILCLNGYKVPDYTCSLKENKSKKAELALKMMIHRLVKYIGAYSLLLGRVDAIILTAAIGERNKIVYNLLKKEIKPLLNQGVQLLQIPTNEELMMARYIKKASK